MSKNNPTFGDPEVWAYQIQRDELPAGDHISIICGWCDGPVGSSGQCERSCETRRVVDTMTPDEIVEMIRRDAEAGDIQ